MRSLAPIRHYHLDKDPSPNITMMIDSGASHILVRFEHAHILKYITMSDTKTQPFVCQSKIRQNRFRTHTYRTRSPTNWTILFPGFYLPRRRTSRLAIRIKPADKTRMLSYIYQSNLQPSTRSQQRTDFTWI